MSQPSVRLYSAGDCPVCADSGADIFLIRVSDGGVFAGCPLCGCAWTSPPDPFVLDSINPPVFFAPNGFRVATRDEIDAAGLGALIQREHAQNGLSFIGAAGYEE
jgi:hypothetical protein